MFSIVGEFQKVEEIQTSSKILGFSSGKVTCKPPFIPPSQATPQKDHTF